MVTEAELNLNYIISNIVAEKKYSHCRLCLGAIQEHYVLFEDSVTLDTEDAVFQPLSEVLISMGLISEVSEQIPGIEAVCTDCVDKVLSSARFIQQCKRSTELLNNTLNTLTETLKVELETRDNEKLYITVGEHECNIITCIVPDNQKKKQKEIIYALKKEKYHCTECNVDFKVFCFLKSHNITYHSSLTCDKCLKLFSGEEELNNHISKKHKFKCPKCPQFRSTQESLIQHQSRNHGLYVCKICGKTCTGIDKLHTHEQHHKLQGNVCPQCGKTYQTRDFYFKHVELCQKGLLDPHPERPQERPHSCEQCGKGYSTPGGLRVHMRFAHGDAQYHICKECGKKFTAPSYLKIHMIKHTGEKNFECDMCANKFVSKEALLYHTRRHTGEKPYGCKLCDERFVNASARAEHVKFKHVGPTLECNICNRKFVTKFFLRKHKERYHNPLSKPFAVNGVDTQVLELVEEEQIVETNILGED